MAFSCRQRRRRTSPLRWSVSMLFRSEGRSCNFIFFSGGSYCTKWQRNTFQCHFFALQSIGYNANIKSSRSIPLILLLYSKTICFFVLSFLHRHTSDTNGSIQTAHCCQLILRRVLNLYHINNSFPSDQLLQGATL